MSNTSTKKKTTKKAKKIKKLNDSQFRVAVAKDVIAQIKSGRYKVSPGTYLTTGSHSWIDPEIDHAACQVAKAKTCHVCAIGSMVASILTLKETKGITNSVFECGISSYEGSIGDISNIMDVLTTMTDVWGILDADLMEIAFECGQGAVRLEEVDRDLDFDDINCALIFSRLYPKDQDRLIAIMQNVVDNNGRFFPGSQRVPNGGKLTVWDIAQAATGGIGLYQCEVIYGTSTNN